MQKIAIVAVAAALAAGCATQPAPEPMPVVPAVDVNSPLYAPMFLQMATSSNLWEIQSSQLALQKSTNPAIQSFAQMIIADHTMLGQQMMAAAQSAGLPPPPQVLMPEEQQMLAQLQAAPAGASFDMAYRDAQVMAHQKAIGLFQNYSASGDNPTLRATAAQALPKLQQHLATAQALAIAPPAPPPIGAGERG